jgi:hypothetical protein
MAAIAEPPSRTTQTAARRRRASEPAFTDEERARLRARHRRDEIIGIIAFCAVLLVVYFMRNYSLG